MPCVKKTYTNTKIIRFHSLNWHVVTCVVIITIVFSELRNNRIWKIHTFRLKDCFFYDLQLFANYMESNCFWLFGATWVGYSKLIHLLYFWTRRKINDLQTLKPRLPNLANYLLNTDVWFINLEKSLRVNFTDI